LAQRCDSLKPNLAAPQWRTAREAEPREIGAVLVVLRLIRHATPRSCFPRCDGLIIICCILCDVDCPRPPRRIARSNETVPRRSRRPTITAAGYCGVLGVLNGGRTITAAVSSSANCLRRFICAVASASFCASGVRCGIPCSVGYRTCGMGYHAVRHYGGIAWALGQSGLCYRCGPPAGMARQTLTGRATGCELS
jgi:hypothetical protein